LWGVKKNSLTNYDLNIGNLLYTLKKVAKSEAQKTLAFEVQNNMHVSCL